MDTTTLVIAIVCLLISYWIIYEIIAAATKSKKIYKELELQTFILVEIAKKIGVDEKKLNDIEYEEPTLNNVT